LLFIQVGFAQTAALGAFVQRGNSERVLCTCLLAARCKDATIVNFLMAVSSARCKDATSIFW
jgi:hypothetical protein